MQICVPDMLKTAPCFRAVLVQNYCSIKLIASLYRHFDRWSHAACQIYDFYIVAFDPVGFGLNNSIDKSLKIVN